MSQFPGKFSVTGNRLDDGSITLRADTSDGVVRLQANCGETPSPCGCDSPGFRCCAADTCQIIADFINSGNCDCKPPSLVPARVSHGRWWRATFAISDEYSDADREEFSDGTFTAISNTTRATASGLVVEFFVSEGSWDAARVANYTGVSGWVFGNSLPRIVGGVSDPDTLWYRVVSEGVSSYFNERVERETGQDPIVTTESDEQPWTFASFAQALLRITQTPGEDCSGVVHFNPRPIIPHPAEVYQGSEGHYEEAYTGTAGFDGISCLRSGGGQLHYSETYKDDSLPEPLEAGGSRGATITLDLDFRGASGFQFTGAATALEREYRRNFNDGLDFEYRLSRTGTLSCGVSVQTIEACDFGDPPLSDCPCEGPPELIAVICNPEGIDPQYHEIAYAAGDRPGWDWRLDAVVLDTDGNEVVRRFVPTSRNGVGGQLAIRYLPWTLDPCDPIADEKYLLAVPCSPGIAAVEANPAIWYYEGGDKDSVAAFPADVPEASRGYIQLSASVVSLYLAKWQPGNSPSINVGEGNNIRCTPRDFSPGNPNRAANLELLRASVGTAITNGSTSLDKCEGRVVVEMDVEAFRFSATHQQFQPGNHHNELRAAVGWNDLYNLSESDYNAAVRDVLAVVTSELRAKILAAYPAITQVSLSNWHTPFALFRDSEQLLDDHLDFERSASRWSDWDAVVASYDWIWQYLDLAVVFNYLMYSSVPIESHPWNPDSHTKRITDPATMLQAQTNFFQRCADTLGGAAPMYVLGSRGYRQNTVAERLGVLLGQDVGITLNAMKAVGGFEGWTPWALYGDAFAWGRPEIPSNRAGYPLDMQDWLANEIIPGAIASGWTPPSQQVTIPASVADSRPPGSDVVSGFASGEQSCWTLTSEEVNRGIIPTGIIWVGDCNAPQCGLPDILLAVGCSGFQFGLPRDGTEQYIGSVVLVDAVFSSAQGTIERRLCATLTNLDGSSKPQPSAWSIESVSPTCTDCVVDPDCPAGCGPSPCPPCPPDLRDNPASTSSPGIDQNEQAIREYQQRGIEGGCAGCGG